MSSRLIKRLISGALALTLVFSINGFAAIVTDSDGSAFITKAEFDSLKNSFQQQIDAYNNAIDNKIDGSIAAYLSGIKIETNVTSDVLLKKLVTGDGVGFIKNWSAPETKLGGHWQAGGFIVLARNAGFPVFGTDPSATAIYNTVIKAFNSSGVNAHVETYSCFKTGFSTTYNATSEKCPDTQTSYADHLEIFDLNKDEKNYICRYTNGQHGIEIDSNDYWEVTPMSILQSTSAGGNGANLCGYPTKSPKVEFTNFTLPNFSGGSFGTKIANCTATWKKIIQAKNWNSTTEPADETYGVDLPFSFNVTTNDVRLASASQINLKRFAGNTVGTSANVYAVNLDDWSTCDNSIFKESFGWKGAIQLPMYKYKSVAAGSNLQVYQKVNYNTSAVKLSDFVSGLPSMKCWMKKYTRLKENELVMNTPSALIGDAVHYYNGVPLFVAPIDGVARLKLIFDSKNDAGSADTSGGFFSINNQPYSNEAFQYKLQLFKDQSLTTLDDGELATGSAHYERNVFFTVEAGKIYWLKCNPNGNNTIFVDSENKAQFMSD